MFLISAKLGEKQATTPEGFLLCLDVPVARTGEMLYAASEIPDIEAGPDGIIKVTRSAEDLFTAEFFASLNGKSVVVFHPEGGEDVSPSNWKDLTGGVGMNPRRGEGEFADYILMDLLITDAEAIELVRSKSLREISLGYDANVDQISPGCARQHNFIGNHIALVEEGRCGPRCSIGDKKPTRKSTHNSGVKTMTARQKYQDALKKLKEAIRARDAEAEREAENELRDAADEMEKEDKKQRDGEPDDSNVHIHVNGSGEGGRSSFTDEDLAERFRKNDEDHDEFRAQLAELASKIGGGELTAEDEKMINDAVAEEVGEDLDEEGKKTRDSAILAGSFQDTASMAEIIMPGVRLPEFDAKAPKKMMLDAICGLRRKTLELSMATPDVRGLIEDIHGSTPDFSKMTCAAVRTLFRSVGAAKRRDNNSHIRDGKGGSHHTQHSVQKPITSIAELNRLNEERRKHN